MLFGVPAEVFALTGEMKPMAHAVSTVALKKMCNNEALYLL